MLNRSLTPLLCLLACLSLPADASELKIENGPIRYHSADRSLAKTLRTITGNQSGPTYVAYSVPSTHTYGYSSQPCSWNMTMDEYQPNSTGGFYFNRELATGQEKMYLILKLEKGSLSRLTLLTELCSLNAGGQTLHWINDVQPTSSIAWLSEIMDHHRDREALVTAVAMHRHPDATEALVDFSLAGNRQDVRHSSVFWLGQLNDPRGNARLEELIQTEENLDLREHLAFVLSTMKTQEARDQLYGMALRDSTSQIRNKALFWMCQSGHPDAESFLLEKIETETESGFLEEAGFMLSQLPDQRGISHLAKYAESHPSSQFRQNAIFWLSQSIQEEALPAILKAIEKDTALEVRKHAVFALSQVQTQKGQDALIRLAESHKDREVRGTALFWLGQKASERVKETLKSSVMNDEDQEVMEQALMGITQLRNSEKVPLLLEIAQTHPVAEIREQALFWLGQSGDERAIALFKKILSEN